MLRPLHFPSNAIKQSLAGHHNCSHDVSMFLVTEADIAAICAAYEQGGELAAAVELRRRFKGIPDNEKARACVRSIIGWKPLPAETQETPA